MTIKERVLASLKTSYAKYGFKKDELSSLTDIISANLTDESTDEQVTAAVNAAEGYARMMQTVYNRGISETNRKYEGYVPKPQEPTPPPAVPPVQTPPPNTPLTAEDVKKLIAESNADRQKAIDAAVAKATAPFLAQQEKARLSGLLQGHEKLKNVPKVFREKYSLEKEEELEAKVEQIESEYAAFKQELVSSGQFVEAPAPTSQESETDDFVKMMEGYSERNAPQQPASK